MNVQELASIICRETSLDRPASGWAERAAEAAAKALGVKLDPVLPTGPWRLYASGEIETGPNDASRWYYPGDKDHYAMLRAAVDAWNLIDKAKSMAVQVGG